MKTSFRDAFFIALHESGRSMRDVAIASGVSYEQLKKFKQGKSEKTNAEDAAALAAALGHSVESLLGTAGVSVRSMIAVAGRVGAGAIVNLTDDHTKGEGLYQIICPPQIQPSGVVGVEIEGDSMVPIYHPGDVLLYSRHALGVPSEALNRICVAEDMDGHAWVKQVRIGTEHGLFNLISANPSGQNMLDVPLKWAAPVRLHLPAEFVKRV
ncbi:S24 family peptidase [Pararhodobacter zhoushanensis]|uniref:Phage repressor protein n=1 Tax=Pararhodobacter zhoushanensis TaxID=2479545 RepID=A0ABT3H401_9RHOB|nr:S24 family peptidase [Pararhodobacter zhoushanensis]MCW1934556.1 phage repressor protein [Pararhodobacter zhoushanensis]